MLTCDSWIAHGKLIPLGEKYNKSPIYQAIAPAIVSRNYSGPKRHRDKSHRRISVFRTTVAEGREIQKKFDTHDLSRLDTSRYLFSVRVWSERWSMRRIGTIKELSKKKLIISLLCSNGRTMSLNLEMVTYYIQCNINMQNIF